MSSVFVFFFPKKITSKIKCIFKKFLSNPNSHGVLDSVAEAPPQKSRKESFLTPCFYIAFVTKYFQVSHAKNQPETSKFEQDFRNSKFYEMEISHHLDKRKIYVTCLILKIQDSNFTCKANFHSRTNYILTLMSKDHFFIE